MYTIQYMVNNMLKCMCISVYTQARGLRNRLLEHKVSYIIMLSNPSVTISKKLKIIIREKKICCHTRIYYIITYAVNYYNMYIRHAVIIARLYGLLGDYHSFFFHSLVRRPEPNEYKTFSQDDQ